MSFFQDFELTVEEFKRSETLKGNDSAQEMGTYTYLVLVLIGVVIAVTILTFVAKVLFPLLPLVLLAFAGRNLYTRTKSRAAEIRAKRK